MSVTLTSRQQAIYDYMQQFTARNGYPPAVREIAQAVGLRSPSTVHFHLKALEEAGVIQRGSGKNRAITLVEGTGTGSTPTNLIPLLGRVAAGSPIVAEQMIEDYIPFNLRGNAEEHFALKIRGDSMINAGILPEDVVIVRRKTYGENGEIVIALLGEEATCKRYRFEEGQLWLLPENDNYAPIDGRDAQILGKVVGVVRNYE